MVVTCGCQWRRKVLCWLYSALRHTICSLSFSYEWETVTGKVTVRRHSNGLIRNQSGRAKTPINQSHCFVTVQSQWVTKPSYNVSYFSVFSFWFSTATRPVFTFWNTMAASLLPVGKNTNQAVESFSCFKTENYAKRTKQIRTTVP